MQPKVSVIIPAYNQADYLGAAIQSVLDQTYQQFELIVVNDASPDHTRMVVQQFQDSRLIYIEHPENRHLAVTRNTGIRAASGEVIAFLDADDLFHPDKLQAHVRFLAQHPTVGVTYNARFEFYGQQQIFGLWRPPVTVTLADLVLGFPFAPSDMVLRREWLEQVNLFDESYVAYSEDLDINCRLGLAGCTFAGIDRPLNYRRHYRERIIRNVQERMTAAVQTLEKIFSDQRCPQAVTGLYHQALGITYLVWAYEALLQEDTALGQTLLRQALQQEPAFLQAAASELRSFFVTRSMQHGSELERFLHQVFAQLPDELAWLATARDAIIAQAYQQLAVQAVIWGRRQEADAFFAKAAQLQTPCSANCLAYITHQLLSYEQALGAPNTQRAIRTLLPYLTNLGYQCSAQALNSHVRAAQAFQQYTKGQYTAVPGAVIRAILGEPGYLMNRGMLAILAHSLTYAMLPPYQKHGV